MQTSEIIRIHINGQAHDAERGVCLASFLAEHHSGDSLPCGGHGQCGHCRVFAEGTLSPLTKAEQRLLSDDDVHSGVRLACQCMALGDCTVRTENSAIARICADGDLPPIRLHPMFVRYGAAIDIGTTTLAARLYDANGQKRAEATRLNPQSSWGADVVSRMEAALHGDAKALAASIRRALDDLLSALAEEADIPAETIDGIVIAGNTVMLYLLTETSPEPLSHAPFVADRLFDEMLSARELGLHSVSGDASVYLPPCIGAFVGADAAAALLSARMTEGNETEMLVDIGTNGEILLRHEGKLYACSTAAGPAFEGAGLSMGMSGKAGAIDHVQIVNGALYAHVIGDGTPRGLCGSGVVDALACLLDLEEMDETGLLEENPYVIAAPVSLTQADIRMIQLAKSAVHAGIRTLLAVAGLSCSQIRTLHIAGGFGSYLDVKNAGKIALLPGELVPRMHVLGNAALNGAAMLLLNADLRATCKVTAGSATLVELSTHPTFADEYVRRMMF